MLIDISVFEKNKNSLCYTLLFGSDKRNGIKNICILNATIEYILSTERFYVHLWITEIHYFLFPSLTSNLFVQELGILNVNLTSQISTKRSLQ